MSTNNYSHHINKLLKLSLESSYRKKQIHETTLRLLNRIETNYEADKKQAQELKIELNQVLDEIKDTFEMKRTRKECEINYIDYNKNKKDYKKDYNNYKNNFDGVNKELMDFINRTEKY